MGTCRVKKIVLRDILQEKSLELQKEICGRSYDLKERYHVLSITNQASTLASTSKNRTQEEVASEANELRIHIDAFLKTHRPSRKEITYLRFARECIDHAEQGRLYPSKKITPLFSLKDDEISQESYELAEAVYELAEMLYKQDFHSFQSYFKNNFSFAVQEELLYHVEVCQGNFYEADNPRQRMKVVQGILGFAHSLTDYYSGNTPYPRFEEIHETFRDLAFVTYLEEEES